MRIDRLVTRAPICIGQDASPAEAATLMHRYRVGSLLVLAPGGNQPAGIVTDRDLALNALGGGATSVGAAMTPVVATVSINADSHEALSLMSAHGVRRLVVTGRNAEPLGVLSIDDLVDGLAVEVRAAASILKGEVRVDAAGLGDVRV